MKKYKILGVLGVLLASCGFYFPEGHPVLNGGNGGGCPSSSKDGPQSPTDGVCAARFPELFYPESPSLKRGEFRVCCKPAPVSTSAYCKPSTDSDEATAKAACQAALNAMNGVDGGQ